MDKLASLLLILVTIQSCRAFFMVCPPLTRKQCPNIPSSCRGCGGWCGIGNPAFQVNCHFGDLPILPQNSFSSLQTVNEDIYLDLHSSRISRIDDDAFSGIEHHIKHLYLNNNSLTVVPAAIGKLHNLTQLSLGKNPIRTVSDSDIAGFSNSLGKFSISLDHMTAYPTALDKLHAVWDLSLKDIPFDLTDPSIFKGRTTISTLLLTYSANYNGRYLIPPVIVNLPALRSVYIYGRKIPCDCSLAYLKHWDVSLVRILSPCTNGRYNVVEYIKGDLQQC